MITLQDEVALVTGASRGIGLAIAIEMGRHGAIVIGTSTTEAGSGVINRALSAAGVKGAGIVMNVNDVGQIESGLAGVQQQYGGISILVNNAGITRDSLLVRMKEEEWDEIMSTNLKSAYRLSKMVLRGMMKAKHGRIINITSVVGATGNAGQANYAAAKAGLTGFTKSLAREVGGRNITVNCIAPGFIDTDMTRSLNEEQRKSLMQQIPMGRLGLAKDVASAAVFLASAAASYVTGQTLHVNGGMYMN
jgi:3-oxoacyl-[acyl-carrier protein] reductase